MDTAQSVPMWFIAATVGVIFAMIAAGVAAVRRVKHRKEEA